MEGICTPYHWFLSIHMFDTYTTSRTSTKDLEIQLHLPRSKFIMVPINKSLILNSHCTKWIIHKNVWKSNLKTIAITIILCNSYVSNVQILENDDRIHLKNGETLKVKRGCYTMKDIEKVSSGRVKYDSLTGKSVTDSIISRFRPCMNKILRINNGNYIDTLLSKKMFLYKINKLSTTNNIFNGKPCDILYTGYLNKDISFGDIVYFVPKNIQYKKLVSGVIDRLKISLIDGDGDEISNNFKILIVLHII